MENQENSNNINPSVNLQNQNINSNAEMRDKINEYNSDINRYNNSLKSNHNAISNSYGNNGLGNSEGLNNQSNRTSKKARNDANNAEAVQTAADIASKSGHPVASLIGNGIKAADKISGGKASEKLGKSITKVNRSSLGGAIGQRLINKGVESGLASRINKAYSKKNRSESERVFQANNKRANIKPPQTTGSDLSDSKSQKRKTEESYDDGKENVKISLDLLKKIALLAVPVFAIMVFMVLLVAGSQVFLQANQLGQADSVNTEDAEKNIDKLKPSKLDEEINDVSYINDIYVNDEKNAEKYEFVAKQTINNQEASLDDLKDFYPEIVNYISDDYNQNDVYKFFKKLYYINKYYSGQGVTLDLPLIMSILRLQSDDMSIVFKANTKEYTKEDIEKGEDNPDFQIDKDWSGYKSTRSNSAHDIEVLAQGMAKEGTSSTEKDGNYVDGVEFMDGGVGKIYYFNQLDYPNEPYGSYGTIASHGCGPTALSIAISSLLKQVHNPIELTKYVCSIGGCTNAGSTWQSITDTPPHYGLKAKQTTNTQEVISALGTGKSIVIVIMCPGHFTSGGHFITLTATKSNGMVTVADPASRDRSKDWPFNTVAEETCGSYWIVSK